MAAEQGFFCTEGFQFLLEAALSEEQTPPANFYVGLVTDAEVQYADNLAALTELSGNNYSAQAVASNNTDLTSASNGVSGWKMTTKEVTFTASGGAWSTARWAILKTSSDSSGKLLGAMRINGTTGWAIADGQHIDIAMILSLAHPAAASVSTSPSSSPSASPSSSSSA